jgi:hypothetical protein
MVFIKYSIKMKETNFYWCRARNCLLWTGLSVTNFAMTIIQECGLDLSVSGRDSVVGSCEHSNKPPSSVTSGEFLDQLSDLSTSQKGFYSMELEKCFY